MKKVLTFLLVILFIFPFVSGCKKSPIQGESLKVERFVFCSEIKGDRDFKERKNKTFSKDEEVLIYTEASNFTAKSVSGMLEYWPILEVEVKDPNGNYIIERQKLVDQKLESESQVRYLYFPITLTFPEDAPSGKYEVKVYFRDSYSDRKAETVETFFLE